MTRALVDWKCYLGLILNTEIHSIFLIVAQYKGQPTKLQFQQLSLPACHQILSQMQHDELRIFN